MGTHIEKVDEKSNQIIDNWKTLLKSKKSFFENLTRMSIIWVMNLKSIILNWFILLEVLTFFIICILFSMVIMPFRLCGGVFTILGIALPTLIILGAASYNTRESSVYKNMNMSGTTRNLFYFGQLLTAIIVANVVALLFWTIVSFIGIWPTFLGGWIWQGIPRIGVSPFSNWAFLNIIYITQLTAGVSFSLYFLISRFAKGLKSFYIMTFGFLALGLIFGGSINSYFNQPHNYSYYDLSSLPDELYTINWDDKIIEIDSSIDLNLLYIEAVNQKGINPYGGLMPKSVFIPTLFNPFYGIGEFTSDAITLQMTQSTSLMTDFHIIHNGNTIDYSSTGIVKWYSWFSISFVEDAWMWTLTLIQPYLTALLYFLLGLLLHWIDFKGTQ